MAPPSPSVLRVGVLLTFESQLLDMSGIDLFGMMSKEYMEASLPKPMVDIAMDVTIHYIGRDGSEAVAEPTDLRALTAQAAIKADVSVTSDTVQPGAIDILLIPGPPPKMKHSLQTLDFIRAHNDFGTTILVVCTGCFVAAQAGILDGRTASGPRALIPQLRKTYPRVTWDDSRRFVCDTSKINGEQRELWTSGGICNGLEMIAAFLRHRYPGALTEAVCAMADVGDKGEYYDSSVGVDRAWWLGQILRALFFGQRTPKHVSGDKQSISASRPES